MRRRCRSCSGARPPRRCSKPRPAIAPSSTSQLAGGDVHVVAVRRLRAGCRARAGAIGGERHGATGAASIVVEPLGRHVDGPRLGPRRVAAADRPSGDAPAEDDRRRGAAGVHAVRGARSVGADGRPGRSTRSLEPLIPGFLSASAAMDRVVEQIQRLSGQRPDGADHRRERHRQGAGRARDSRRLAPQRRDVPALQLHDDRPRSRRQPAVRPSPRQLHRRGLRSAGPGADGRRRHAVPRRDRRPPARRPAEAAALPRAARDHADRRDASRSGSTCACWRRPTPISSSAWRKESFARTSTTA